MASSVAHPDQSGRKVVFLHVLKTGGMTFAGVLSKIYGNSYEGISDPSIAAIEAALRRAQCIELHTANVSGQLVNMHAELMRLNRWDLLEGHHVFTMLREPVGQTLSLYHHVLRTRAFSEPLFAAVGATFPNTLDEFLDLDQHYNTQTAFLSDSYGMGRSGVGLGRPQLEQAKDLLLRLRAHVGLTDRFADSLNVFETVTGSRISSGVIHNRNQGPASAAGNALPDKLKDRIREKSALDLELYEFGKEIFLQDFARCGTTPAYRFVDEQADQQEQANTEPQAAVQVEVVPQLAAEPDPGTFTRMWRKLFPNS